MEENREFFRITNKQAIKAKYINHYLEVEDISGSGVKLRAKGISFAYNGYIEIVVNYISRMMNTEFYSFNMEYEFLRKKNGFVILVFKNENQIMSLSSLLKKIATDKSVLSKTYY